MRLLPILLLCLTIPVQATLNREVLIDAIGQVETGGRAGLVGKRLERGPYQMLPSVVAQVGGYDKPAALRWLDIVINDLTKRGVYIGPHSCAMAWNAGARTVAEGRAPMSTFAYALRVSNLYALHLPATFKRAEENPLFELTFYKKPRFIIP